MNILTYIKNIKEKVESVNEAIDNPICKHNPFCSNDNTTYVWVEEDNAEN